MNTKTTKQIDEELVLTHHIVKAIGLDKILKTAKREGLKHDLRRGLKIFSVWLGFKMG